MSSVENDREQRIAMEIVVDADNEQEQAMGWYYYLEGKLNFPFKARWLQGHSSPSEEVEVVAMAHEEECSEEMWVEVLYREGTVEDTFSVPLAKIMPLEVDEKTREAVADWHYWVDQGYDWTEPEDEF